LSDIAEVIYKCTDVYHPEDERAVLWNDPTIAVAWPVKEPIVSPKDERGIPLEQAECF
jgi:dTDP-4-dehydrorhamnose 3,5-epimerase